MLSTLGETYTQRLRLAYRDQLSAGADFVCYWFEKAREMAMSPAHCRVGLVATQSIRKGTSRDVLDAISREGKIFEAWADEPWVLDGAAVRVSLVCFGADAPQPPVLDGIPVATIFSDLTAGASDLTTAMPLEQNKGVCFQGPVKVGAFDISGDIARQWLLLPSNPNGRSNSDVLRPWVNGMDVVRRPSDTWIIDFSGLNQSSAALYIAPFAHVVATVKPERDKNRDKSRREKWWLLGRSGSQFRSAVAGLTRYIVTARVSRFRTFSWAQTSVVPDSRVFAFCRDDDAFFGILHSRFHESWSLAQASRHGVGNDPTYNNLTCFETFPFPDEFTPSVPSASYAQDTRAQGIAAAAGALVLARDRWLNPPELVDIVPEVVAGFPDRILPKNDAAAVVLKTRTLTALYNTRGTPAGTWLDNLHAALDAAVAAAYGWPADISTDEALTRLLALNQARAGAPSSA